MLLITTAKGKCLKITEAGIPYRRLYSDDKRRYYPKGVKVMTLDFDDRIISVIKI